MKIIFLAICLALYSCSSNSQNKSGDNNIWASQASDNNIIEIVSSSDTIYNDNFIINIITNVLNYENLLASIKGNKLIFISSRNNLYSDATDSIFLLTNKIDSVFLIKGHEKVIVKEVIINSNYFQLDYISVGMLSKDFERYFEYSYSKQQYVEIHDTEGGNVFKFEFENNQIIKITYMAVYLE